MAEREFRLYDTMSRTVKPLQPQEPGHLKFYSCGPTVYNYAHIGNFRTFVTADLILRTGRALGWQVSYVTNITDVGHLTEDDVADAGGEDKMARALRSKDGEAFANVWDLAEHYANAFKEDWDRLNLVRPMVWPRATQHLREQIEAVQRLIETGHAYTTDSAVYFRLTSFPEHGKLSGNRDKDQLYTAVRDIVVDPQKEHPGDFALWKRDDKHLMQWYSPWGWGFPGWHIECSVMAMQYLGETLDLHCGGEDLVFPHHESEIAQSECLTGKEFSRHWVHTRFLQVDGEKMSKSTGNYYTVRDLVEGKGVDPLALRYALMTVPYGKPLNFTMQNLRDAVKTIERYRECLRTARTALERATPGPDSVGTELNALYDATLDAMCDDLNTSVAVAKALEGTGVIFREGDRLTEAAAQSAVDYLQRIGDLLGVVRVDDDPAAVIARVGGPSEAAIEAKIAERQAAKAAKDFARADAIRAELDAEGIELRDTPDGPVWKRKTALV